MDPSTCNKYFYNGYSPTNDGILNQLKAHIEVHAYGKNEVLKDISLQLSTQQIVGLFGRNGSGKSTFLKILFGSLQNKTLQLEIDSIPISQKEVILKRSIAYLPQDSFLPENKTVRTLIPMLFPDGKLQELIFYRKGVASFEKTKIGNLSIGQRKYLELLLLCYMPHPFLLLDEPFSMVEPLYKEEIKKLLEEIKLFKGIIITDHYYHDVFEVSTCALVLKDGFLLEANTQDDLKKFDYLKKS